MAVTRSGATKKAASPAGKAKEETKAKVTKPSGKAIDKASSTTKGPSTKGKEPLIPKPLITRATSAPPSPSHGRGPTTPQPRRPSTPSPITKPTSTPYIPPKRRRSSQTLAARRRNAIVFYNKLLPVASEMAEALAEYDGEGGMFRAWHLVEEALGFLGEGTGGWDLETGKPFEDQERRERRRKRAGEKEGRRGRRFFGEV
ncbi:hypothetical protein LTR08_000730 [Meristemomyces frigidus]|nr:hypothetical protein LTR08_000730 [Meristemomyces frigidus]